MIPQPPPRTAWESLDDMGRPLDGLGSLLTMLKGELSALAVATLPDDKIRRRLLTACAKEPFSEAWPEDYRLSGGAPETARLLSDAIGSLAGIAREVEELKALRLEPFSAPPPRSRVEA